MITIQGVDGGPLDHNPFLHLCILTPYNPKQCQLPLLDLICMSYSSIYTSINDCSMKHLPIRGRAHSTRNKHLHDQIAWGSGERYPTGYIPAGEYSQWVPQYSWYWLLSHYHPDPMRHLIRHCNMPNHLNILGENVTFMAVAVQQCGISHPVRHPLMLRPPLRRNPSWQPSISTNSKQIKGLSMIPGSSWNQKSQTHYAGSRFPKKLPQRPPSNIQGKNIGLFFGRMENPLGLRKVQI